MKIAVAIPAELRRAAMGLRIEKAHTTGAGAGAAAVAGALKRSDLVKGKKVSITVSGCNVTLWQFAQIVQVYQNSIR